MISGKYSVNSCEGLVECQCFERVGDGRRLARCVGSVWRSVGCGEDAFVAAMQGVEIDVFDG